MPPYKVSTTVTNPDGQSATVENSFEFNPQPVLESISPNSGPSSGGTLVTLTGSGFMPGATVKFGTTLAMVVSISPDGTVIQAVTPPQP